MNIVFPKKNVFSMDVERDIDGAMLFFDFLKAHNLHGEFFFTGSMVKEHPVEFKKISKSHFVGAHGFNHENFSRLSFLEQKKIFEKTQSVFFDAGFSFSGWRFPRFQFNSASMRLLSEKKIPDFSLGEEKLRLWGNFIFVWNFFKCALAEQTFFVPLPFPSQLEEHPFLHVDLFEREPLCCNGRVVLHCYNAARMLSQL